MFQYNVEFLIKSKYLFSYTAKLIPTPKKITVIYQYGLKLKNIAANIYITRRELIILHLFSLDNLLIEKTIAKIIYKIISIKLYLNKQTKHLPKYTKHYIIVLITKLL